MGEGALALRCGEVLATGDCEKDLLEVLGGDNARSVVHGEHKEDLGY